MENLIIEIKNHTALITINRPEKLNALNKNLINELSLSINELKNNSNVKVILLTGKGEKAFVAGADISEFIDYNSNQAKELAQIGHNNLFDQIENSNKPIIALINGFALGGGLELAMACHFRLASENAKLGLPEVTLGIIPGYGGTQRLADLVGKGFAMQMILTAEMITAQKALDIKLINEIIPQEKLIERGKELAQKIIQNSSTAIEKAIYCINKTSLKDGFKQEINSFSELFNTSDFKEGVNAFIEKRKPNFI